MRLSRRFVFVVGMVLTLGLPSLAQYYWVVELEGIAKAETFAYAINNRNQVVGKSGNKAVLWQGDQAQVLPGSDYGHDAALAINEGGIIVGYIGHSEIEERRWPVYWQEGVMHNLQTLEQHTWKYHRPLAINTSGTVVGYFELGDYRYGMYWSSLNAIGNGGNCPTGVQHDVNETGQVVGYEWWGQNGQRAFVWSTNSGTYFLPLNSSHSVAHAINSHGAVVGWYIKPGGMLQAYLWQNDQITLLGSSIGRESKALDINTHGNIVGVTRTDEGAWRPFVIREGFMEDLNQRIPQNSGWILESAEEINDNGRIVGYGTYQGKKRAFMLIPIRPTVWFR